ncbi:MAG TPA: NAD(P)/FAD-dependent oxidoreductase [Conexibacter sp.]
MAEQESYDLLIAGGGPAGLAAAAQAAAAGLSVALVDERVTLGGQIYKRMGPGFEVRDPRKLGHDYARGHQSIEAVQSSGARVLLRTSVLSIDGDEVVLAQDGEPARKVTARRRLLSPGAYDRPVAFPGWTLPGVLTAGGAQTLVKTQRVLPGENILFAGSGPLAVAFPAQLHRYGANVSLVLEAGPPPRPLDIARMLAASPGNIGLLRDAAVYRGQLLRGRIPLRYRRIVVRAEGDGRVESVTHAKVDVDWRVIPGSEETVAVDTLCLGYGFTPSIELPRLAGCAFAHNEDRGGLCVVVDEWMRTTVPGVLAAGDGTGVEGSYVAEDEGRLAAIGTALDLGRMTAAQAADAAAPVRRRLKQKRAFLSALTRMHRIGPGVFELAAPDTVVCRCEEVRRAQLDDAIAASDDINVVKSLTRAGMGLCQGRNCQRQIAASLAARHGRPIGQVEPATPRFPARPVTLGAIAKAPEDDPGRFQ